MVHASDALAPGNKGERGVGGGQREEGGGCEVVKTGHSAHNGRSLVQMVWKEKKISNVSLLLAHLFLTQQLCSKFPHSAYVVSSYVVNNHKVEITRSCVQIV